MMPLRVRPPIIPKRRAIWFIPRASPRFFRGVASTIMAALFVISIAPPMPWRPLNRMTCAGLWEMLTSSEPMVKTANPAVYILTLPTMSVALPISRRLMVLKRTYA